MNNEYVKQLEEQNEWFRERLAKLEVEGIAQLETWKPRWVLQESFIFTINTSTTYVYRNKVTMFAAIERKFLMFSIPPQYFYFIKFNNELEYCCDKMLHDVPLKKESERMESTAYPSVDEAKQAVEEFIKKVIIE